MAKLTETQLDTLANSHKSSLSALNALVTLYRNPDAGGTAGSTPVHSSVASSTSSVTLVADSPNRLTVEITNDSTSILYIKKEATVSSAAYTYKLFPNDLLIIDDYTGVVSGIWVTAVGTAQITETTY
tara:strand:- start:2440 stop:2823 length:384 start_codon:yes stop_codon:yes gene_type:complete